MNEFTAVFGKVTLADLVVVVMAIGFVVDKAKSIIKWITKRHDDEQEKEDRLSMIKKQDDKINNLTKGMLALLSNDLFDRCEQALAADEITINDLDKIKRLYDPYHALGGNGTGTKLFNDVLKLHIKH